MFLEQFRDGLQRTIEFDGQSLWLLEFPFQVGMGHDQCTGLVPPTFDLLFLEQLHHLAPRATQFVGDLSDAPRAMSQEPFP